MLPFAAGLLLLSAGCNTGNRVPALQNAMVSPPALRPGDRALITVELRDKTEIVSEVVAIVREDPRLKLPLVDDGTGPDAKADDGVWTTEVVVPFNAPSGEFTLDIRGYGADGEVIPVPNDQGNAVPLGAETQISIALPEDTSGE